MRAFAVRPAWAPSGNKKMPASGPQKQTMTFEMLDQPEDAERVAVLRTGRITLRVAWRIEGDVEGGALVLDPRATPCGWSLQQARSAVWTAIQAGSKTLAGVPALVRRAARAGTLVLANKVTMRSPKPKSKMPDLSMFETDPATIARGMTPLQLAYLRGELPRRPRGSYCGTVTNGGQLTERGRAVLLKAPSVAS